MRINTTPKLSHISLGNVLREAKLISSSFFVMLLLLLLLLFFGCNISKCIDIANESNFVPFPGDSAFFPLLPSSGLFTLDLFYQQSPAAWQPASDNVLVLLTGPDTSVVIHHSTDCVINVIFWSRQQNPYSTLVQPGRRSSFSVAPLKISFISLVLF